jgi:carbonic anhydrase
MHRSFRLTRRKFVTLSSLAAGSLLLPGSELPLRGDVPGKPGTDLTPDAILRQLLDGNKRFTKGETLEPRRKPEDFARLAEGQKPLAVIISCADSRVSPELLFDQGIGDLFVVRIAGNVISGAGATVKGSIEYAVAELGVSLVLVLGHGQCGAVKSALKHIDARDSLPGAINDLVNTIKPAVARSRGRKGDALENAIQANVEIGVERLRGLEPILAGPVKKGKVKVVGGVYDLKTGAVNITVRGPAD